MNKCKLLVCIVLIFSTTPVQTASEKISDAIKKKRRVAALLKKQKKEELYFAGMGGILVADHAEHLQKGGMIQWYPEVKGDGRNNAAQKRLQQKFEAQQAQENKKK